MADISKISERLGAVMDLLGPVIGVMVLLVGIRACRDGGSVFWPVTGAALLALNLCVAWRRLSRCRKPKSSS